MAEGQKPLLTGIAAGVVVVLLVTPVGYVLWKRASAERAQMLATLSAIDGKLAKTDAAVAGVQKASLDEIRNRLDQVETSLKSDSAALAGLQKGLGPDGLNKRLGQLSANLAALDTSLATIKLATANDAPVKTASALDTMKTGSVPAQGATDLI